ncbi:putative short-chain dehydrogenases/reductase [Colletotrichum somersetense]|nr:putative short-chain dehydrogenases/reductase [Colletotrichum somersetense]
MAGNIPPDMTNLAHKSLEVPSFASYPDIKGKVVFLTGIGQTGDQATELWGNGAAIALVLAKQGAKIFGVDLNLTSAQRTRSRIAAEGGEIAVMEADVTKADEVQKAIDSCLERHSRIDILINNVGRSEPGGPAEMAEDVWDAQMDVNLKSVYLTCHAVLPLMERQGGDVVVNLSSIAGLRYIGKPQVAYAALKAGVIQFTKATAVLYAKKNVRLNVVVPGLMHTPLVTVLAEKYANGDVEGLIARRHNATPMGHMGNGFDVAMAAAFLASDQSRYITGQKIVVDGGITSATG